MGVVNSLTVRHRTGRILVEDATSIATHGRHRRRISLADLDEGPARQAAQRVLTERAQPRSSWTAAIEVEAGTAAAPYGPGGWRPLDTPSFDGTPLRCVALTTSFDRGGNPIFEPTLQTRRQFTAERAEILLERASATSLGGTAREATPLPGIGNGIAVGEIQRFTSGDMNVEAEIPSTTFPQSTTSAFQVDELVHLCRLSLRQVVPNTTRPTVLQLLENGTPKAFTAGGVTTTELVLPAGVRHVIVQPEYLFLVPNVAAYQWECVDCDDPDDDPEANVRLMYLQVVATRANPAAVQKSTPSAPWE